MKIDKKKENWQEKKEDTHKTAAQRCIVELLI